MSLNIVLLDIFLTLHTSRLAYFFHIPFTVIQRTLEGPGGNEWAKEMFGFLWLSRIVAGFWATSVLVAYQQLPTFDVLRVPDMSNTLGIISSVGTCRSTWSSL